MRTLFYALALAAFGSAQAITTTQVMQAFKAAGLEASGGAKLSPKDYGIAPYVGQGVRLLIPSLGTDNGGRIFDVPNSGERARLVKTYVDLGKQSAFLYSWVFQNKNIVVQINGDLPEEKALKYKAVLMKLR